MVRQTARELSPLVGNPSTAVAADALEGRARRAVSLVNEKIGDSSRADAAALEGTVQPTNGASPKVLNLAEAAALVRCSRAHLSNIVNGKVRGIPRLPTVRIGRRVLFRRESLESWLQQVESLTPLPNSR